MRSTVEERTPGRGGSERPDLGRHQQAVDLAVRPVDQPAQRPLDRRGADAPDEIVADGLEIHRTGTSQHFEMNNFNVTSSVVYDYTVMPLKAGTFTIPCTPFIDSSGEWCHWYGISMPK